MHAQSIDFLDATDYFYTHYDDLEELELLRTYSLSFAMYDVTSEKAHQTYLFCYTDYGNTHHLHLIPNLTSHILITKQPP